MIPLPAILGLALVALLGGCTITDTFQGDTRKRSVTWGIAVFPDPTEGAYSVRMRGLGLQLTIGAASVGYFDTTAHYIPVDCFGHFVVRDAIEAARIMALFPSEEICATTGD